MGTINYGSNKHINVGFDLQRNDCIDAEDYCFISECIEDFIPDVDFFTIEIEPGYYEGMYLFIDFNDNLADYTDKMEAQKEITELKKFFLTLLDYGFCTYNPGWCTAYYDREESKEAIKQGIKEMRAEVKAAYTDYTYEIMLNKEKKSNVRIQRWNN